MRENKYIITSVLPRNKRQWSQLDGTNRIDSVRQLPNGDYVLKYVDRGNVPDFVTPGRDQVFDRNQIGTEISNRGGNTDGQIPNNSNNPRG